MVPRGLERDRFVNFPAMAPPNDPNFSHILRISAARPEVGSNFRFRRLVPTGGLYTPEFFRENPSSRFRDMRENYRKVPPFPYFDGLNPGFSELHSSIFFLFGTGIEDHST